MISFSSNWSHVAIRHPFFSKIIWYDVSDAYMMGNITWWVRVVRIHQVSLICHAVYPKSAMVEAWPFWFQKLAARGRQLRNRPPFSLPDIGSPLQCMPFDWPNCHQMRSLKIWERITLTIYEQTWTHTSTSQFKPKLGKTLAITCRVFRHAGFQPILDNKPYTHVVDKTIPDQRNVIWSLRKVSLK
jgi:hypothetical protein